jgi:hypothetical protein
MINMKSRMNGDVHVRFRENVGVRLPCVTQLAKIGGAAIAAKDKAVNCD